MGRELSLTSTGLLLNFNFICSISNLRVLFLMQELTGHFLSFSNFVLCYSCFVAVDTITANQHENRTGWMSIEIVLEWWRTYIDNMVKTVRTECSMKATCCKFQDYVVTLM